MNGSNKLVVTWLGVVCATVIIMVVVGGVTRLTGSGLSMVDWKPIMGIVPPMDEAEWQAAFDAYKEFPEYREVNRGMDLDGFKRIFFWEYAHRVLGRLIGILFFVPLVVFWLAGKIESHYKVPMLVALGLGGMQGLLGWYMAESGLIDIPRVSHYRLAAHLSLAMFIMSYLFWLALSVAGVGVSAVSGRLRSVLYLLTVLLVLQIVFGAFTAGMRAGYGYNTWPLMNGQFMADAVFIMKPLWANFFESGPTVQFIHRWLAVLVLAVSAAASLLARRETPRVKWAAALMLAALFVQFAIGVLTLVQVVPVTLGTIHQGWACFVLLALVYLLYASRPADAHEATYEARLGQRSIRRPVIPKVTSAAFVEVSMLRAQQVATSYCFRSSAFRATCIRI
ncbi:MAG: COX15/CtaA family protein [Gammaproteobacteria bacterium]|nr:COX15/CtaA family protein [Gammaproteobacteria bacterium]